MMSDTTTPKHLINRQEKLLLREHRQAANMSFRALADKCPNLSSGNLSDFEHMRRDPQLGNLIEIAKALDLAAVELLPEEFFVRPTGKKLALVEA